MTRQDRRPRQRLDPQTRRDAIHAAAAAAFAESGYEGTSTASIAARAGASEALLFRYFESKAGLFAAVVSAAIADLAARQRAVLELLPPSATPGERVRATTEVYLEHIAHHPMAWAEPLRGGREPATVTDIRRSARAEYVGALRALLVRDGGAADDDPPDREVRDPRVEYALWGYFGFLDAAALRWVEQGCPKAGRKPLIATALGALHGALGEGDRLDVPRAQSASGER